jgi:hypothetical protein
VQNTDLLVYVFNSRNAAKTEKEGISLCRHWLCGTRHSLNSSNRHVRILILLISETLGYEKPTSSTRDPPCHVWKERSAFYSSHMNGQRVQLAKAIMLPV